MKEKKPRIDAKSRKKARRKRRYKFVCFMMSFSFCAALAGMLFLMIKTPDKEMSESENRVLKQSPTFTFSSLADGSFMKSFESYLTDQFPYREDIIYAKTFIDRSVGKRKENGVYIGENGCLFEEQTPLNDELLDKTTSSITNFSLLYEELEQAMILSPNSSCILNDYLPYGITIEDQQAQLQDIGDRLSKSKLSQIDCTNAFFAAGRGEQLFYRTDHHWTTRAAYQAFLALAEEWELDTENVDYAFYAVSNSFRGTLASSSGVRDVTDKIEICVPQSSDDMYTVYYESQQKKTATLFDKEKLSHQNQYEVFLGGNFDKVIITTSADTDDTLLLLKDSYANCMIPMLTPYFSKIVVVDPRYFSDSLDSVMQEYDFTHLLFVYNLNTFLEDISLADVLES